MDFSQAKSRSREARKQATRARFYAQLRELEADEVSKRVRQMVAESAGLETGGGGGGSSSRGGGASAAAGGRRSYHTASGRSGEGSDWDDDDGESVFGADGGDEEEDGASDGFFMDDVEYEEVLRAYMGARPAAQQQRPAGSRSSRKW